MQVRTKLQDFADVLMEVVQPPAVFDADTNAAVALLIRENLRLMAEDMTWVPNETRIVEDEYLEVRFRISMRSVEAVAALQEKGAREAFEASRRQVANLLEE